MLSSLRFSRGKLSAMSRRAKITVASFAALAAMPFGTISLCAATYYWSDPAAGLWQATGPSFWYTDAAGTTLASGFPVAGDNAVFNYTGGNADTVLSLNNTTSANSLTFNSTGTTQLQSTSTTGRNLFLTGGITVNAGAGAVTIGNSGATVVAQVSGSQTYTNNSTSTLLFRNAFNSVGVAGNSELTLANTSTGGMSFVGVSNGTAGGSLALTINSTGTGGVSLAASTYTGGTKIVNGAASGAFNSFFNAGQGTVSLGDATPGSTGSVNLTVSGTKDVLYTTAVPLATVAGTSGTLTLTTGSAPIVFTGTVTLGNNLTATANGSNSASSITFGGVISGAGALTATRVSGGGSAPVVLTELNTYTGGTFVGTGTTLSGVLQINNGGTDATASAIGTGRLTIQGAAGGLIDNTSSGDVTLATNNAQTWNSDFTYVGSVHSLNLGTGAVSLGTSALATRTVTVSANTLTVGGVISDGTNVTTPTTGLTKGGSGTLVLGGANTFSGALNINGGIVQLANATPFAANNAVIFGSGSPTGTRLQLNGNSAATGALSTSSTNPIIENASSSNVTLTTTAATSTTFAGVLQDGTGGGKLALTKSGAGTLTLSGANTYTGATTVSNGGGLTLAFSAGVPNNIASTSALTLGGSTLTLTGAASTNDSQTFASTTLNTGASAIIATIGSSGNVALALGAISRNAGSAVNLTLPGGTSSAANSITTTTPNGATSILGGWATVGSGATQGWAVSAGSSGSPGALAPYSGYGTSYSAATSVTNFDATASGVFTPTSINSLRFVTGAVVTSTLNGAFVIGSGGILRSSAVGGRDTTITGGTSLTSGNGSDLIINNYDTSNKLVIGTPIVNNGATTIGLTTAGGGTTSLTATNTYTGQTYVNSGTLLLNGSNTSAITTATGATVGGSGSTNKAVTIVSGASVTPGATGNGSNSVGKFSTGALTLSGTYSIDLSGTGAGGAISNDQLSVTGAVTLDNTASLLSVNSRSNLAVGDTFFIVLNDGTDAVNGTFNNGASTFTDTFGDVFSVNYAANGDGGSSPGNDISLSAITVVPEPSTYLAGLLVTGALGWNFFRRRRAGATSRAV